jgi:hypothetical protein
VSTKFIKPVNPLLEVVNEGKVAVLVVCLDKCLSRVLLSSVASATHIQLNPSAKCLALRVESA